MLKSKYASSIPGVTITTLLAAGIQAGCGNRDAAGEGGDAGASEQQYSQEPDPVVPGSQGPEQSDAGAAFPGEEEPVASPVSEEPASPDDSQTMPPNSTHPSASDVPSGDEGSHSPGDLGPCDPDEEEPEAWQPLELCDHEPLPGAGYADSPEFWRGDQATWNVIVEGYGYLAGKREDESVGRFFRRVELGVSPEGYLEHSAGEQLLGYAPGPDGELCLGRLRIPRSIAPLPTTEVFITANLDAKSGTLPGGTFRVSNPAATANYSTSLMIIDPIGESQTLDIYFVKADEGLWQVYYLGHEEELHVGGTPGQFEELGFATLEFDTSGALTAYDTPPFCVQFAGTEQQCISVDFGDSITQDHVSGLGGSTQFASPSSVSAQWPNGHGLGFGATVRVGSDGTVRTSFDSMTLREVGRLAIARFRRESGLTPIAPSGYRASEASGGPRFGLPATEGNGLPTPPLEELPSSTRP